MGRIYLFLLIFSAVISWNCKQTHNSEIADSPCVIIKHESDQVIVGQPYRAEIFINCNKPDSLSKIKIRSNLSGKLYLENGKLYWQTPKIDTNQNSFRGEILITKNDGNIVNYTFEDLFKVVVPKVAITNLNFPYLIKAKENPLKIEVAGFNSSDIVATAMKGSLIKKSNDEYTAVPYTNENVVINITVRVGDKRWLYCDHYEFKVIDKNPIK